MSTHSEAGAGRLQATARNGKPPGAPGGDGRAVTGETGTAQRDAGLLIARRKRPTLVDVLLLVAAALVIALSWKGLPDAGVSPRFSDRAHEAVARQLGVAPGTAESGTRTSP